MRLKWTSRRLRITQVEITEATSSQIYDMVINARKSLHPRRKLRHQVPPFRCRDWLRRNVMIFFWKISETASGNLMQSGDKVTVFENLWNC